MDSDDDTMDGPPPEYFKSRRRSNTLPTDILRNLRDKHTVHKDQQEPTELTTKLRKYLTVKPPASSRHGHKLAPLNGTGSNASSPYSSNESVGSNNGKKQHKSVLTPLDSKKYGKGSVPNLHVNGYRPVDDITHASSLEALNVRRSPLPRGSNLYESLMEEFGHDEEERDKLSPLPSPELKRKSKNRQNVHIPLYLQESRTHSAPVSPANARRRVHWSEDVNFNKYSKK